MNESLQIHSLVIKDPNVNIHNQGNVSNIIRETFYLGDVNDLYLTLPPGGVQDVKMLAPFAVFY